MNEAVVVAPAGADVLTRELGVIVLGDGLVPAEVLADPVAGGWVDEDVEAGGWLPLASSAAPAPARAARTATAERTTTGRGTRLRLAGTQSSSGCAMGAAP